MAISKHSNKKERRSFNPSEVSMELLDGIRYDLNRPTDVMVGSQAFNFFVERQLNDYLKKTSFSEEANLEKLAFSKFINNNLRLGAFHPGFPGRDVHFSHENRRNRILIRARAIARSILAFLSEEDWFLACRHSSGTSLGLSFSETNLEDKWRLPMTATKSAMLVMHRYFCWDKQMAVAIGYNFDNVESNYTLVYGSRLTTVPKTSKERRIIAVEPTANMYLQQGLAEIMSRSLASFGVDIESQQFLHTRLAYYASVGRHLATIDWSMASDSVSCSAVEFFLPAQWNSVLHLVRCSQTEVFGSFVDLNMISSMGNATTFPLQTLLFFSVAQAVCLESPNAHSMFSELRSNVEVTVFGDDCILPSAHASEFIGIMESIGFICNKDKSFWSLDCPFRESCGSDFYLGRNVRPVYLRDPHNTRFSSLEPWLYSSMNNVIKKYISCFGRLTYLYDKEFFRCVFRIFAQHNLYVKVVPSSYPDDSGLHIAEDFGRWQVSYPDVKWDRVVVSDSKLTTYTTCTFRYRFRKRGNDHLRYVSRLKS